MKRSAPTAATAPVSTSVRTRRPPPARSAIRPQTILATIRRREAGGAARGDDLLATLLKPIDETDPTMSRRDLRDEVVGMFLAGYETTATTLAWTLHLLARYPDIQARARDEVDRVLVSRTPGLSDLPQLGYLSRVLQETQRYRPVSWMIPRTAAEDDDIGGFRIPAGAIVASCTYGSHHNRSIWNDPGTFDPDRFLPGRLSEAQARAWVPFGLGQHLCVGRDFAVLEMHIVLSMILQRFTWFEIPERPVGVQVRATIKPKGGVWVKMRDRNG